MAQPGLYAQQRGGGPVARGRGGPMVGRGPMPAAQQGQLANTTAPVQGQGQAGAGRGGVPQVGRGIARGVYLRCTLINSTGTTPNPSATPGFGNGGATPQQAARGAGGVQRGGVQRGGMVQRGGLVQSGLMAQAGHIQPVQQTQPTFQPAVQQPAVQQPAVQQPAVQQPAVQQPAVQQTVQQA